MYPQLKIPLSDPFTYRSRTIPAHLGTPWTLSDLPRTLYSYQKWYDTGMVGNTGMIPLLIVLGGCLDFSPRAIPVNITHCIQGGAPTTKHYTERPKNSAAAGAAPS